MISIITCSIKPHEAESLRKNIENTIGVPFEFIAYDNRGTGKGICQVYNECAENARYENLCFIHEDVEFHTKDWGAHIIDKLKDKDCGIIGFAGSTMKSKYPSGWGSSGKYGVRMHMIQVDNGKEFKISLNPDNNDFSQVITTDGLCMFIRKDVWRTVRFDETVLKGFHCYDVDISIAAHIAGYKNYICHTVLVKHFSAGNYDTEWWTENKKMHRKWDGHLPLYLKRHHPVYKRYLEYRTSNEWTYRLGSKGVFNGIKTKHILGYLFTHLVNGRSYKLINKYLKYRLQSQKAK